MNPISRRLGLPVAVMMTSATSVEGALRALKNPVSFSGSLFIPLPLVHHPGTHSSYVSIFSSIRHLSETNPYSNEEDNSGEFLRQAIHSSPSCTLPVRLIHHSFQSLLPYDISQKPTRSPTSSPTSPPTSSPTLAPVSPGPPPSGGTPFVPTPSGGCTLNDPIGANNCTIEAPYCMLGYNKETICSACTGLDSDCTNTPHANGQYCVTAFTQSGYACAECKINGTVSFGCKGTQTCGTPRCVADLIEYCSEDHDADRCLTPTSAPTRRPRPTTPAQIFN